MKQDSTKTKKPSWIRTYLTIGLIAIVLVSSACLTFAYFMDNNEEDARVSFGIIEIDREFSIFRTGHTDNVLPGGILVDQVSFKKSARSRNIYVRVRIEFGVSESSNPAIVTIADGLNANIAAQTYVGSGYKWVYGGDGYYYLCKNQAIEEMYHVTNINEYIFSTEIKYDVNSGQLFSSTDIENNEILQYQQAVEVSVNIQAVQSENLPAGLSYTINQVKTIFPAVTKSFTLQYLEGQTGAELVTSSLNVGDTLPVIINGNYRLLWLTNEDGLFDPIYSDSVKIRPSVNYYGVWFFTGNANYTATASGLTAYNGSEKNLILPRTVGAYSNITTVVTLRSSSVNRIVVPEGYTTLGSNVFGPYLKSIILPNSLTTLGSGVFHSNNYSGFSCILTLTIPANVTTFGSFAINAPSLQYVTFLGTKVTLSADPMRTEHNSYFEVIVPDVNYYKQGNWATLPIYATTQYERIYSSGIFYIEYNNELIAISTNRDIQNLVIPATAVINNVTKNVVTLDKQFDSYNYNLKTVTIGPNVRSLLSNSLMYDSYLTSITVGANVTSIATNSIYVNSKLNTVTFLGNVTTYNNTSIRQCALLTSFYVPAAYYSAYISRFTAAKDAGYLTATYVVYTGTP